MSLTENELIENWKNDSGPVKKSTLFWSPLTLTVYKEWMKAAMFLIKNGVNVNEIDEWGNCALSDCVTYRNNEMLQLFLHNGANMRIQNCRVFKDAVSMHNLTAIKSFVAFDNSCIEEIMAITLPYVNYNLFPSIQRFLHAQRLLIATMILDLPQYIILWITDWLPGSDCMKEYEKVQYIESIQRSIKRLKCE